MNKRTPLYYVLYFGIYVYTYTYMHVLTTNEKKAKNLKESKECMEGFEERKGKE